MKIAGNLTINDWADLEKKLDVNKDDLWENAFDFFEQRIRTRYLNPIHQILKMDLNTGEGFAVVNLQCSLIETIECFYNGWSFIKSPNIYHDKNGRKVGGISGKKIFNSFFDNRKAINGYKIKGADFYENVRCGLLHETQTKNNWIILTGDIDAFKYADGKCKIYREAFQEKLEQEIENLKLEMVKKSNTFLRECFISKFNHICKQS